MLFFLILAVSKKGDNRWHLGVRARACVRACVRVCVCVCVCLRVQFLRFFDAT